MRYLKPEEIPALPMNGVVDEQMVAFGVFDPGIVIQFMDTDKCILMSWEDIVAFGLELIRSKSSSEPSVEIDKPTEAD
jgi:hypothetical protein